MRHRIAGWTTAVVAIASAVLAGCGSWPAGFGAATTVVGRGDPAVDVAAVQQAVALGGTVLLKGVFDFGERGNVTLTRDVAIVGERAAAGQPATRIRGGYATLRSLRPEVAGAPGPKIEIRQIHFDGATWMPMQLAYASGVTVRGNLVTNVKPVAFPGGPVSGGKPFNMQQGVLVGGVAANPGQPTPYRSDAVTGSVTISDNTFELANDAPRSTMGQAVWIVYATGIDALVSGNRIRNATRNAIEVIDNYRGPGGEGRVVVRDNDIETPAEGVPIPSPRVPNGILVGYFMDPPAAEDERRAIPHAVVGNTIRLRAQASPSFGIAVMANGGTIADNRIILASPGALALSLAGSRNEVRGNRIEGSGSMAVAFAPWPPMKASGNQLVDNDVTRLQASAGEFALMKGANQNRIAGSSGRVIDGGEGNVTDGLVRTAPPAR